MTTATEFSEVIDASSFLKELDKIEECRCESNHVAKDNRICSGKVTHRLRVRCLRSDRLVCASQAAYTHRYISAGCLLCHNPAKDCWTIIPI